MWVRAAQTRSKQHIKSLHEQGIWHLKLRITSTFIRIFTCNGKHCIWTWNHSGYKKKEKKTYNYVLCTFKLAYFRLLIIILICQKKYKKKLFSWNEFINKISIKFRIFLDFVYSRFVELPFSLGFVVFVVPL